MRQIVMKRSIRHRFTEREARRLEGVLKKGTEKVASESEDRMDADA